MKRIPKLLCAGAAAAVLAGTAALADNIHHMTVRMPDGGQAHIDYVGDKAPAVRFLTPDMVRARLPVQVWSPFGDMERISAAMDAMSADLDRRMTMALRQARELTAAPMPGLNSAGLKALPPGTRSWSVTTISNGKDVCTRSVRVTSTGKDARPQVVSNTSGDCNAVPLASAPGATAIKTDTPRPANPRRTI